VDGFINSGPDSTIFRLSRSVNFGDTASYDAELQAQVLILGSAGDSYLLVELGNGEYAASGLILNSTETYQVKITTSNGERYESEPVPLKPSPPIDSLHWQTDSTGISIYLNTHDPMNSTRYYQWNFTQTWEHRAQFQSYLAYVDGQLVSRDSSTQILRCWTSNQNTNILISTSAGLGQDIVSEFPLVSIDQGSEELSFLYSIQVTQNALTANGYTYWLTLKSNTEQLGGLFSPLPSELTGNLHCLSNPSEPVLGYVSGGAQSTCRLFIGINQLTYWAWFAPSGCLVDTVGSSHIDKVFADTLLFTPLYFNQGSVVGTDAICGDCRRDGGTNVKPPFWPN
jgi:hypothetical protein